MSAGVSSFIAGYLAGDVDEWIYIDIADQHEDSIRFIHDCEKLIGKKVTILQPKDYKSVEDCIRAAGMIKFPGGFAPCTNWLKKRTRKEWEEEHKEYELTYVWGYDAKETARAERLVEANPQAKHEFPLIEWELSKQACHSMLLTLGLNRPMMYDQGYPNNNCLGCIKGGMGYWNKIRIDYPEVFEKRAKLEREIGYSILKDGNGNPIYLDELDPDRGDMNMEVFPECGMMCYLAMDGVN